MSKVTVTTDVQPVLQEKTIDIIQNGTAEIIPDSGKVLSKVTVTTDGTTEVYHLDLTSIGDFGLANQFTMRSNDIVYIDASGLARWQRVLNQIMPFSNALYNLDRLGQ